MDVLAIVLITLLFSLSFAYTHGCARLKGEQP